MNARIVRMRKEARALFWPWCAMVIMGALPLVLGPQRILFARMRATVGDLSGVSFWLGIPLLAVLSLENEFRCGTISLWLAQPSSRMQLWREKLIVSYAAVLSVAAISSLSLISFFKQEYHRQFILVAIVYVIVAMASATFWILMSRSTTAGFVFTLAFNTILLNVVIWALGRGLLRSALKYSPVSTITAVLAFAVCYGTLTLWLGARKLAGLQLRGAGAGEDLVTAGPALMPEALARWFRCQPTRPFLNLIRKEFRLLRPLWLSTLLGAALMAVLAIFGLIPDFSRPAPIDLPRAITGTLMIFFLSTAILAGSLSMGEERKSGTHAWHMALPVPFRRQWFIKLATAVLGGLFGAVLLPVLVFVGGGYIHGSPSMYMDTAFSGRGDSLFSLPEWSMVVLVLSFASFWCACAVNGTARAAIWVCPVTSVMFLAGAGGDWLGRELTKTTGTLRDFVISSLHLSPLSVPVRQLDVKLFMVFIPVLFGVIQSYRLFRIQPQDKILWMMRCVLPLALASLLCNFALSAGFFSSRWEPFAETANALVKLQPAAAKIEVAGDDLTRGAPVSSLTRGWLTGSSISVTPDYAHPSAYIATIHLTSGLDCSVGINRTTLSRKQPSCAHRAP